MHRFVAMFALTSSIALAQTLPAPLNLGFEEGNTGDVPPGWHVPKSIAGFSARTSSENPKSGKKCAEILWTGAEKPSPFGNLMQTFDATPYRGKRVRFRAAVRSADATSNRAQLWFREDRTDKSVGFIDNMDDRPIRTTTWQYFEISEDIDNDAAALNIGVMLFGKGSIFIDDASVDLQAALPTYNVSANASFDKLAAASKLWVFIKYMHPRVTAPGVDWDQAFVDAAPHILAAKTDEEFATALTRMLSVLQDPATQVRRRSEQPRWIPRLESAGPGVQVVKFSSGTQAEAAAAGKSFGHDIAAGSSVVFDLRGTAVDGDALNYTLQLPQPVEDPPTAKRIHSGYVPQTPGGYQGYYSAWENRDGTSRPVAQGSALRPVFLVNAASHVPGIALAAQNANLGAIVSEGPPPSDSASITEFSVGNLTVAVRTAEISYRDGTTGFTPNLILSQTGDEALQAAAAFAKQSTWPTPPPRTKLNLPPALFQEKPYFAAYPSTELRMLAAARIWGVFQYFHPYKHLYGEDWDAILSEFLPRLAAAKHKREYHLAVAEMVTHTHDTHCYIYSPELMSFQGSASAAEVRWIEDQPVVTRVVDPDVAKMVHPGDVVTRINGEPVQKRIDELSRVFTVSNENSRHMRVMQYLLNGPANASTPVSFRGADGQEHEVALKHETPYTKFAPSRPGDPFRLLNPKVGYIDLDKLTNAQVDAMFDSFENTDAIIMDMRGYPQGTAWSIAPRLAVEAGAVNAQFRTNIVTTGGEGGVRSQIEEQHIPLTPKPRYKGKTILLIDDRAMSQSEHSGLMYKTANGTTFIGSGTAGANGDVTNFTAPGGIRISFSGHDVRWPDGKQLQRVGLIPDIEAKPTIEGIRQGRDEVLERALQYLQTGR